MKSPAAQNSIYQTKEGEYRLTTAEKKRILLNNIYGVDIDSQAVEVTKLSLLLKVLEGETEESLTTQLSMFRERALPDLSSNIKCGNSLIGPDFYEQTELDLDEEEHYRINVFDWNEEFKEIMNNGGFDCVIGNPPYVRSQQIEKYLKNYFALSFEVAAYQPDTFAFFVEKGIKLISNNGRLSFILPNGLLTNTYYEKLRKYILDETSINIIVDLKDGVFRYASVDTFILVITKNNKIEKNHELLIGEYPSKSERTIITPVNKLKQKEILSFPQFRFNTGITNDLIKIAQKIESNSKPLQKFFSVKNGMKVRKIFIVEEKIDQRHKKFLLGKNIKPYRINWTGKWVCYDKKLEKKYSNQAFREKEIFEKSPRILVRQVMGKNKIYAAYDEEPFYVDQSIYLLLPINEKSLHHYLGIIASTLMAFYFSITMADRKITFPKIKGDQIKKLPLLESESSEKIVEKVKQIINLKSSVKNVKTPQEKKNLERQIAALDKQIDQLVYELYGLTDDEIKIVEESMK